MPTNKIYVRSLGTLWGASTSETFEFGFSAVGFNRLDAVGGLVEICTMLQRGLAPVVNILTCGGYHAD